MSLFLFLVPVVGLEPTRPHGQQILSLSRLPIPTHRLQTGMSIAHPFEKIKGVGVFYPLKKIFVI